MKKLSKLALVLVVASTMTSCYVNTFNVGKGGHSGQSVTAWNHYLIGGLIPLGVSNPQQMAGGAADYTVTIKHSFINGLLSSITYGLYSPTTTIVTK